MSMPRKKNDVSERKTFVFVWFNPKQKEFSLVVYLFFSERFHESILTFFGEGKNEPVFFVLFFCIQFQEREEA